MKTHLKKYLIIVYAFFIALELIMFLLYYRKFNETYIYHNAKFNSSFAELCYDYVKLNTFIILPICLPFTLLFLYQKSKSAVFCAIGHSGFVLLLPIFMSENMIVNFMLSVFIGLCLILIYIGLCFLEKLFVHKAVIIMGDIIIIFGSVLLSAILYQIFLRTLNYNDLGYIVSNVRFHEYAYSVVYELLVPVMSAFLLIKQSKYFVIIDLTIMSGLFVFLIFAENSTVKFLIYSCVVPIVLAIIKSAANNIKKIVIRRRYINLTK